MRATRTLAVVYGLVSVLGGACGRGASSSAAQEPRARAVAAGAVGIWDDALVSGWADWSWGSTRATSTSIVASGGAALAVTFQAWGGVYFRRTAGSITGMDALELYANGGSSAGNKLLVWAVQGSTNLPGVTLASYCTGSTIPAGAWTRCHVPLAALAPAGTAIDGIALQEVDGAARPVMYLDSVTLVPRPPAQPTGVTATAAGGSITVGWPAVASATTYDVLRATASAGPFALVSPGQAGTSYLDTAVTAGATYWYRVIARNAGGGSDPSAAVSATAGSAGLAVYADGLAAGWADWSWGSTRDLAAASPVASGTRSMAVTFQAWGGIYFRHTAGPISGMASFALSANGGTAAGNRIEVRAVQGTTELANVMLASYCAGGTIPAGAWTRCTVPLTALAPAGSSIDGIILQEIDGTARPTMYLDDVSLAGSAASPPPPPPPPPATVTVAISPASATVDACTTAQFGATVSGATGAVTWTVQEGAAGGAIDASGRYTAPSAAGTYHVVATSGGSSASATVVVKDHVLSLAVNPVSQTLAASGKQQFAATVTTTCGTFTATSTQ